MAKTGIDWTDAFDNSGYIPGAATFRERWPREAASFRERVAAEALAEFDIGYGSGDRNRLDLFRIDGESRGLVVFVHGGYWYQLDKSVWSHLAQGPLAKGWDVAIPSYTLAPEATISDITREIGMAIEKAAAMVEGPIRLAGHSAGGHLVSRMICDDSPLSDATLNRLAKVVSVSGVHDLRPLLLAEMNTILNLTEVEAEIESPALHKPASSVPITFWVGARERPEFLRQNRLIGEKWSSSNEAVKEVYQPVMNHFTVVEQLADPDSPLVKELLSAERDTEA